MKATLITESFVKQCFENYEKQIWKEIDFITGAYEQRLKMEFDVFPPKPVKSGILGIIKDGPIF